MTPKERLLNRLDGKPVDRIPNLNIVMQFAAKHAGVAYGQFCTDYRYMAATYIQAAQDFGIDILSTMSDPYREVADYGVQVDFPEDGLPLCKEIFLKSPADIKKLVHWDPYETPRNKDRRKVLETFKKETGDNWCVLGWVEGPWAEFTDLASVSNGSLFIYDEPDFVRDAVEFITEQQIIVARAQIDAGADIIGIGDAAASLLSLDMYRDFVKPYEKRIIDAIHAAGAKTKLHICGDINRLLPDLIELDSDIIDVDYMVDLAKALRLSEGKCSISGNIHPVEVFLQGTADDVRRAVRQCVAHANERSIISSGCEIPRETDPANVRAMDEELRKISER